MEWNILFMGPVGSGKTTAIRTISDIEVVDTDMRATDDVAHMKSHTTVSMDVGKLQLGEKDKLRLCGAPGQDRFDFMWDILLEQCKALVLVINHASTAPLADLEHYLKALETRKALSSKPLALCISHVDARPERPLSMYADYLRTMPQRFAAMPPVLTMDARNKRHVRAALMAVAAMLEMAERFPKKHTERSGA